MSRVYTIPAGAAFLKALARGLLECHPITDNPFALADVAVLLPTQRAMRALEEVFLEVSAERGPAALLLPAIRALGEDDEDEIALFGDEAARDIPPAVSDCRRLLLLAERLEPRARDFPEALAWAKSLARFLDEILIDEKSLSGIVAAVPEELSEQFAAAREFLSVLAQDWPRALLAEGVVDRAERRRRAMDALARRWAREAPGAVYIAGSTGTIPATRRLMKAALALPQGVLILPGLDRALDAPAWSAIDESHPQFGLKQLLEDLGLDRAMVADWPYTEDRARMAPRARLLSEVLRPAPTTDSWAAALGQHSPDDALEGLKLHIARDRAEEARVIALAMRETLETPGETAALVTPDRALARGVAAELARWSIAIDDSAGLPLLETEPARLVRLILEAVAADFAPVALLALLKHPSVCLAREEAAHLRAVSALERAVLRGARPKAGLDGLKAALLDKPRAAPERAAAPAQAKAQLSLPLDAPVSEGETKFAAQIALAERLAEALRPLTVMGAGPAPAAQWVEGLAAAAEACAPDVWFGPHGEALALHLAEIAESGGGALAREGFAALFERAAEGRSVRPRQRSHSRLAIWGPLEARLQSADLLILGALNEGVWPQVPDAGPWANRAMRAAIGLSQPERRVGLAAHDFAELASAPHVLLTASEKIDGSPARPSRFLLRLLNFLGGREKAEACAGVPHGSWARAIVAPDRFRPVLPPEPRPPAAARPSAFAITEIKTLRRDPYAIFAKRVLGLRPLEPVDADTGAREMGLLFHKIFEDFARSFPDRLPEDAGRALNDQADARFRATALAPELDLLWRRRFARAAQVFLAWEARQRAESRVVGTEAEGAIVLDVRGRPIALRGRIDRIDSDRASSALRIYDYKTGTPPSLKQVTCMLDPQLALGAFLALEGAIEGVSGDAVDRLGYLRVGGTKAKIDERTFTQGVGALIGASVGGLVALLESYEDPAKPYLSWPIREKAADKGDYDLLARVAEWHAADGSDE